MRTNFKFEFSWRENKENDLNEDMIKLDVDDNDNLSDKEEKAKAAEDVAEKEDDFFCTINKDEVPPAPSQNFLMRNTEPAENLNKSDRRDEDRKKSDNFRVKDAAGRKVKGRGAMVNTLFEHELTTLLGKYTEII